MLICRYRTEEVKHQMNVFQVLHRLDHSIHTMRLWTVTKAKELCSDWNMKIFFQVVHDDMDKCLEHLNDLRLPGEYGWEKHFQLLGIPSESCTKTMYFTSINLSLRKLKTIYFAPFPLLSHLFRRPPPPDMPCYYYRRRWWLKPWCAPTHCSKFTST